MDRRILGVFPLDKITDVVAPKSEDPKLTIRVITFELTQVRYLRYGHRSLWLVPITSAMLCYAKFNVYAHDTTTLRTDRQTDGRTTYDNTRGRLTRGAQLTAGYTVNTYSKRPLYYTLGVLCTAHTLGPPHADRQTRDRHDLPTNQPTNQPFCQYSAVSWEISC